MSLQNFKISVPQQWIVWEWEYEYYSDYIKDAIQSGVDISHANFSRADLRFMTFKNVNLSHTNFTWAILADAIFDNCNLENAEFIWTNLDDAEFTNCNTKNTDFYWAILSNCNIPSDSVWRKRYMKRNGLK